MGVVIDEVNASVTESSTPTTSESSATEENESEMDENRVCKIVERKKHRDNRLFAE